MGLLLLTGVSGVGKSTVRAGLAARGRTALDTDGDGISSWRDVETGRDAGRPPRETWRTAAWQRRHEWRMSRARLEQIEGEHQGETVFICGSAANEDEVWDLFAAVICLYLDDDTELLRRLADRRDTYGAEPHELGAILQWQRTAKVSNERFGARMVDASGPIDAVVDRVLAAEKQFDSREDPGT